MFRREPPPPPLTITKKLKAFLVVHWRGVLCFFVPLISILLLLPWPPKQTQIFSFVLIVMVVFWVSECIPLPITSFIPVVVFPLTGIMDTRTVCKCYMNDTIMMFLGSLFLASAVEQSGLHNRIALGGIRIIGYSHYKLLFTLCFVTMFVSMWITNTAATSMMIPINFAVLKVFENEGILQLYEKTPDGESFASDISACYFCAATYSATIGGIGTLIGTATNLVFRGLFLNTYPTAPEFLSFPLYSAFAVPYMLLMEIACYLYLCFMYLGMFRPKSETAKKAKLTPQAKEAVKKKVAEDWKKLGKLTFWEIMVIILFGIAILGFFSRAPQIFKGWSDKIRESLNITEVRYIQDSSNAILVAVLMLLLPNTLHFFKNCTAKYREELPKAPLTSVLIWQKTNSEIPYSFIFLLGGGFALSEAASAKYTNFNGQIGGFLSSMKSLPNPVIVLILLAFTIFVTNFASNVVVCNVITPIAMQLAKRINQHPLLYNIATGLAASYTFMLPVGTPGNLLVQVTAKVPTKKMIIAGLGPTFTTLVISWAALLIWAPIIWPDLKAANPRPWV